MSDSMSTPKDTGAEKLSHCHEESYLYNKVKDAGMRLGPASMLGPWLTNFWLLDEDWVSD